MLPLRPHFATPLRDGRTGVRPLYFLHDLGVVTSDWSCDLGVDGFVLGVEDWVC